MRPRAGEIFRAFERLFAPGESTAEEERKRTYASLSLVLLIPVAVVFGVEDLRQGSVVEGIVVLATAAFLACTLLVLARVRDLMPLFRLGACLALLLQFYEMEIGGGEGTSFLWFYCIPLLVMTLFGRREGAFWVLAALVVAALAFLTPRGHEYEPGSALRFLITFALVAFFSFGLESSRHRFHSQLLAEKSALEDALAQVKTLRGLLPICARCKKIRDDQGYWQQIELFVDRHTDAEFSHSLCPSCVDKLYPDLLDETD